ncbi:diguanylate cyclase [Actinoplanes sp. CA-030573]|uniref:tetratricopeptide repeat-containing diguanylate cyclase n=1 Tax=Actinoplanes sp. CA-030573 TaxID=3239898 RepID=UPI003D922EA3
MQTLDTERLSAALLELEDAVEWDPSTMLDRAVVLERQARLLGDDLLVTRARLSQANLLMRSGDLAGAARRMWPVHQWAVKNGARQLTARSHLVWATIHRHLGDAAQSLEHAVLSVELLDDSATEHMQVWHRTRLGDALAFSGSIGAARHRFEQAVRLAVTLDKPLLLLFVLNNFAYAEYSAGNYERAEQITVRLQEHAAAHDYQLDASLLDTIGAIEIGNGRYAEAEKTMLACIALHGSDGHDDADELAEYLLNLARAQCGLQAYDRAQDSLEESRRLCVERGLRGVLVRVHQEQADLHAARGEFAEAYAAHKSFFTAYHGLHSQQREAQARTRHAMFETAEARQEAERFREQARRDPLTGLRNRRYIDEQLPMLIDNDSELTIALVDLDHFKRINDQLSHDVGDRVLVEVARLLESGLAAVSPAGFVARMGGEEFLMVLPDLTATAAADRLDMIRRTIAVHDWATLTRGLPITLSIGVAGVADASEPTQLGLLSAADRNLYAAKNGGRDRVVWPLRHRDQATAA